jgi:AraC-like DNA-binding protein/mannose-6-phosphate isomerase-like protein (cupin superfamily)
MNTTNLKEQVEKKQLLSDFTIDFLLRHEKKGKTTQTREKGLNFILFILEGEMNISYHEFRNHLCKAGEMVFVPQDTVATLEAFSDVKYLLLKFNNQVDLHEDMGWNELREFDDERAVFHKLDIRTPLSDVIDSILFYQKNKISSLSLSDVKEKELFLVLKVFYSKQEIARFIKPLLKQDMDFKTFVINHYINAKNVDELAHICNLSVRSFARKFKIQFNDSPYRWILRQKANQIKVLLSDKKIPMQSIIKDFGFSSPAHFTSYCKKQFGSTPSSLRNSLNGKL